MDRPTEKEVLPQTIAPSPAPSKPKRSQWPSLVGYCLVTWVFIRFGFIPAYDHSLWPFSLLSTSHHDKPSSACVQADPILPQSFDVSALVPGNEVRIRDWLSGAVKIPTEMFDVMGPIGEDPRWDVFYNFADCRSNPSFHARHG